MAHISAVPHAASLWANNANTATPPSGPTSPGPNAGQVLNSADGDSQNSNLDQCLLIGGATAAAAGLIGTGIYAAYKSQQGKAAGYPTRVYTLDRMPGFENDFYPVYKQRDGEGTCGHAAIHTLLGGMAYKECSDLSDSLDKVRAYRRLSKTFAKEGEEEYMCALEVAYLYNKYLSFGRATGQKEMEPFYYMPEKENISDSQCEDSSVDRNYISVFRSRDPQGVKGDAVKNFMVLTAQVKRISEDGFQGTQLERQNAIRNSAKWRHWVPIVRENDNIWYAKDSMDGTKTKLLDSTGVTEEEKAEEAWKALQEFLKIKLGEFGVSKDSSNRAYVEVLVPHLKEPPILRV